jgi:glycosyltransferase involved in cell wall biosynthesis
LIDLTAVVTCYQAGSELSCAIKSIQHQTLKVSRILLVDDGSSDCFCKTLSNDATLKVLRKKHSGQNLSLNYALDYVATEYVAFLDDDDQWFPEKTALQYELLLQQESLLAAFGAVRNLMINVDGSESVKDFPPSRVLGASMFRRKVFDEVGHFPMDSRMHGVVEWWSRAIKNGIRTLPHDDLVLQRRIDGNNEGILRTSDQRKDLLNRLRTHAVKRFVK